MKVRWLCTAVVLCAMSSLAGGLFDAQSVHTVKLKFSAAEWAAMEPKQGEPGASKRNGLSAMSGIDFQYVHADMDFDGTVMKDVAVRYKGNSSFVMARETMKRSLKIDLDKFEKGRKFEGVATLNLHNNIADATWMNEPVSYRVFRDAEVPGPKTGWAKVFVSVDGKFENKYLGLYSLVENVDENLLKGGAIFKPSTRELFEYQGEEWAAYKQAYDAKTKLTPEQKQRVIGLAKLVSKASDAEFQAKVAEYVDLDEFARFMAVTVWLSNMDSILSMGQNYYVWLEPATNKFQFVPWDLDQSLGHFPGGVSSTVRLNIEKPWQGRNLFLDRLFKVDAFKSRYLAAMKEFQGSVFKPETLARQMDEIAKVIAPAVKDEGEERLKRLEKLVDGEPSGPVGFVFLRHEAVARQLDSDGH